MIKNRRANWNARNQKRERGLNERAWRATPSLVYRSLSLKSEFWTWQIPFNQPYRSGETRILGTFRDEGWVLGSYGCDMSLRCILTIVKLNLQSRNESKWALGLTTDKLLWPTNKVYIQQNHFTFKILYKPFCLSTVIGQETFFSMRIEATHHRKLKCDAMRWEI